MLPDEDPPEDGPLLSHMAALEVRRIKAGWCALRLNEETRRPYRNAFIGLEIASTAHRVLSLPYEPSALVRASGAQPTPAAVLAACPPSRFTWFCDEGGTAEDCMKVRDDQTGRVAVWPLF
jgi:hypothetical protein